MKLKILSAACVAALLGFLAPVSVADSYEPPAHLKYPYVAVKYVTPTLTVGERGRIGWYVSDFDHSLWRFADDSRRFDVFVKWTRDDATWQTLSRENVPSCDGEFDLGELPVGDYSVGVWCRDRSNGLESHRVWHEFRVVEPGALAIPESQVRRMTTADLATYGLRNDGDYERLVLVDAFDPATRNNGQFNLKINEITEECLGIVDAYLARHPHQDPAGRPGYTVYTAAFNGAPIDRAFCRKRLQYDSGYDRAAVAAIAEANSLGLQRFVDDAVAAGFRKVVLLPGTYRVSHAYTLRVPDRTTLDLGGATLKLDGFDGAGTLMVELSGVTDAHLVNGTVEGDYYEHSYAVTTSPEAVHGWSIDGACRYCSVSNVVVKNVTGYGGGNGAGSKGEGTDYTISLSGSGNGFVPGGLAPDGTVDASDTAQWTSPYKDISAFKPYHYLTVSMKGGYQGVRTRAWNYICAFYDADAQLISREVAFQYRHVRIPPSAKYARFSIEVASESEAINNELTVQLARRPSNCQIVHNVYDRCRCVGHAASAMFNFLFLENEFKFSGECQATCAFDAEDGWDYMQDVLFLRNDFHDNNRNELLTCCGHNFMMVGNHAKISLNARTFAPYVVSNDCTSVSFDCTMRTRTGHARYIDNAVHGTLSLGGAACTDWDVVLRGLTFSADDPDSPSTITGAGNGRFVDCVFDGVTERVETAEHCTFVNCATGLQRWQNGHWTDCAATNCTFQPQMNTNRYVHCTFSDCRFSAITQNSPQTFADCTLVNLKLPSGPVPPPTFYNCTGVPAGYENIRAIFVDAAAKDAGDGSAAHPFRSIADGIAAATADLPLVEIAGGTYRLDAPVIVDRAVTLRAAPDAVVVLDGGDRARALELRHAAAVVEGLRIVGGLGVTVDGGTLRRCLVTGANRADYAAMRMTSASVRLLGGTVERCTIVGDLVGQTVLEIANAAACTVRDTIAWGGVSLLGDGALVADISGLCAPMALGANPVAAHPSFVNAKGGDYRLSPASPCIGAGTDGGDLGCFDFSSAVAALGIAVSAFQSDEPTAVTVSLAAAQAATLEGATVVWKVNGAAVAASGASFTQTFGEGIWTISATVTPAGGGTAKTVTLTDAVRIGPDVQVADGVIEPRTIRVGGNAPLQTIAEGIAAANGEGEIIEVAAGTYAIDTPIAVAKHVAIRAAEGAAVVVDANLQCRCFEIDHALATVGGLTIRRGKANSGAGVFFGTKGGTLTNCVVEACESNNIKAKGIGILVDGKALVAGCTIRQCKSTVNGDESGVGVYVTDGTLVRCLVTGCTRPSFASRQNSEGAVYLAKGTVSRCTITGNSLTHGALCVADLSSCVVRDTICWGNAATREIAPGRPDVGPIGVNPAVSGLFLSNPSFVDAAAGDFRLSPASPCRGAGTGGCDLGCFDYAASDALGIGVSASRGTGSLAAQVSLVADGALSLAGATVRWTLNGAPLEATGPVFAYTFAPGVWDLAADVTLAGGERRTVRLGRAAEVAYTGEVSLTAADDINAVLRLAGEGLRLHLAEGGYSLTNDYSLVGDVRIVGDGDRTRTVLTAVSGSKRLFYLNGADAFIGNVTLTGGRCDRDGGALWVDGRGGTVSNCVIRGNMSGVNAGGGGVLMTSAKAVVSHSLISGNTAGGSSAGGGVLLSQGTLADSLVVSNTMQYADRASSIGGGVCLDTATADARVVNCTIARNQGSAGCGLYRKANAGSVVNTLIYDNVQRGSATLVTPNWESVDGSTRPTATAFVNCCSDVMAGVNPQTVAAAPYDADYRLTGSEALKCVDKGLTDAVFSSVDYEGEARVLGGAVDIGAIECTTIELGVIHVDVNAAAGGDGSRAHPFQTVAEGIAAAVDGEDTVKVASGTYPITAALSVTKAITVQPEPGASVTIDAQAKCQCLSINNADAVVEGLRFFRGQLNGNGAGVVIGANGGTLRDCIIESCKIGNASKGPGIYMNSANALVTGCQVRACGTDGFNGNYECHGVYIDNGVLDRTLVVGCRNTNAYADGKKGTAAVYLAKGTVRNCTIVANEVSHYALYCANAATCHVLGTISWGNVSLRGIDANCPNANDFGAAADVVDLCLDNPMFANTSDYALAPGSPCIGVASDGGDLGWKPYDATIPAIGVRVGASQGTAPLEVAVALAANVPVASVAWEGVEATGTNFTVTLGGGNHLIRATATLADGTELTAENVVAVTYPAGEYAVSDAVTLEQMLASPLADGVVIRLADGTYPMTANCHALRSGVKIIGASREGTVLSKNGKNTSTGRFFYLNHAEAGLANLTMSGGYAGCNAGGVWIDGRGGTVSNCAVRACRTGASQAGGGVWMNAENALVTHSVISGNTVGQNTYCGGVLLSQGTLADSLIVSNTAQYATRTQVKGVGVYMDTATAAAKVVNCTIARNSGYQSVGLYRVANGGFVCNTLVYDNTASDHNVDDNFYSGGGRDRPDATAISNCCSSVAVGTNPQTVSVRPYDPVTYELDGSAGGACIDKGANELVVSATDFFGNGRIFQGGVVDIGAHEFSKSAVEVGFTASATKGVDSLAVVLTASVIGAEVSDSAVAWYVDGGEVPVGRGLVCTNTFAVGRHAIRIVVDVGGTTYEKTSDDATGIVIYPSHVYVDANSSAEPVWPYPPTAPARELAVAVDETLIDGVTIHVAKGRYPMTSRVTLGPDQHIVGAGMDRTLLYHPSRGVAGFHLKSPSASVDGLCVSNSLASNGGGFCIEGGEVTRCRVSHCEADVNQDGGGVTVFGSDSVFDCGVVTHCSRYQWNGESLANGGGVAVANGGRLLNTLVMHCTANNAGGVNLASGAVMCNCTVVNNSCSTTGKGGGGIFAAAGCLVENCIAWGNVDGDEPDPAAARHNVIGAAGDISHCCFPVSVGTACVTAAPGFRNAAADDYRIGASSPCARAGVYRNWMAGTTDFFGNPRATPGGRVSIGFCQVQDFGLKLIVR